MKPSRSRSERMFSLTLASVMAVTVCGLVVPAVVHADEPIAVTNSTLVFDSADSGAQLELAATGDVDYVISVRSLPVAAGTAVASSGTATIDLDALAQGQYEVSLAPTGGDPQESVSFAVLDAIPATERDRRFGVQAHLHRTYVTDEVITAAALAGFGSVRNGVLWESVEKSWGYQFPAEQEAKLRLAASLGMTPLLTVAYRSIHHDDNLTPSTPEGIAAFADYAAEVLDHYGDITNEIEVYNEFNHSYNDGLCGRTADCYLDLLSSVHDALKAVDPDAVVVGPATAGIDTAWLGRLLELGGGDSIDVASAHRYTYPQAPEGRLDVSIEGARATLDGAEASSTPFWLTENGWPTVPGGTTVDEQADYYIRAFALAMAAGAERYYYYDLLNDGTTATNNEHNFGMMTQPTATVAAAQPKPAFTAAAISIRQLGGKDFVDDESSGDAHSIVFSDASEQTRVLWSTAEGGSTFTLTAGAPLTVVDRLGASTTVSPVGGVVTIGVSDEPVFVTGVVDAVATVQTPPFAVVLDPTAAEGEDLVVDYATSTALSGLSFQTSGSSTAVEPGASATAVLANQLPIGDHVLVTTVRSGAETVAYLAHSLSIVAALELQVRSAVEAPDASDAAVVVTVRNNSRTADVEIEGVELSLGGREIVGPAGKALAARSEAVFEIPVAPLVAGTGYEAETRVRLVGGSVLSAQETLAFVPIPWGGQSALTIDLAEQGVWTDVNGSRDGDEDLSGTISLRADAEGLHLTAELTDDIHNQDQPVSSLWHGDGIQLAVSPGYPGTDIGRTEIAILTLDGVASVYAQSKLDLSAAGLVDGAQVEFEREGTTSDYEVVLPWSDLGLEIERGSQFAISIVVNDNDGAGREGFLEWGSGISANRATENFYPASLAPVRICERFDRGDLTWDWANEVVVARPQVTVTKPAGSNNDLLIASTGIDQTTVVAYSNGRWAETSARPLNGAYGSDIQELEVCGLLQ